MRKWGIVITIFYALVLVGLLSPGFWLLFFRWPDAVELITEHANEVFPPYHSWLYLIWLGILVGGQALLLFLSVDTSQRRLKPRQHIAVSISTAALLFAMLTTFAIYSVAAAIYGDEFVRIIFFDPKHGVGGYLRADGYIDANVLGYWLGLWLFWGIVFYAYLRNTPRLIVRIVSWLLKGSVLELLIAVPCHLVVRQRGECSALMATSWGIVTGIAIMLLTFGPSVIFLYKRRLNQYNKGGATTSDKEH